MPSPVSMPWYVGAVQPPLVGYPPPQIFIQGRSVATVGNAKRVLNNLSRFAAIAVLLSHRGTEHGGSGRRASGGQRPNDCGIEPNGDGGV